MKIRSLEIDSLKRAARAYGISVLLALVALTLAVILQSWTHGRTMFFSLSAVVISAYYFGISAGVFTALLSVILADYFLNEPLYQVLTVGEDIFFMLVFLVFSFLVSWIEESRLRSERALVASKAQLQALLDSLDDGVSAQDSSGKLHFVNPAVARIAGFPTVESMLALPEEELRSMFTLETESGEIITPETLPTASALRRGVSSELTARFRLLREGRERWLTIRSKPIFDKDGKPVMAINVFRDITERHELDSLRRATQERLQKVLDNLAAFVGVLKPDGTLIEANRSALEAADLRAVDVFGRRFDQTYWWSHSEAVQQQLRDAIRRAAAGEIVRYDVQVLVRDRRLITIDFMLAPVFDAQGQVEFLIPSGIDITERVRLTRLLATQREQLETILNNVPGIVWEGRGHPGDDAHLFDYVSRYAPELLGYTLDEWRTTPGFWRRIIHPEDWDTALSGMNAILESGEPGTIEFRVVDKDGDLVPVEAHMTALRGPDSELIGACGVLMDITARRQAEEERARSALELQRSNEELQQFAYVASHDLQEPLRMITSYLQLVERRYAELLDDDGREFIGYAVDGASRMKNLINDLLAYSRVQSHDREFTRVSMMKVYEQAIQNLEVGIEESGAQVTADALPDVMGSENLLTLLMQNLIGNAIKYRGEAAPVVHVGCERRGREWLFSVRDNGIGIASEYLERIFIIFQRLHAKDEYSGTGIGLAMCKKVVERHNGRIWAESTVGEGSTFYFTLPARTW